ncbi:1603_t:CDS:2 [Diversispora eburnea]|uniref:1603_t:CDS:1 n=1 Tax=Diversispora eburnea TaxID=1213867 RepID=A0A9N8V3M0_9GLOM|nr:1603_t:CDS:2 [Diversispora eburnea]
MQFDEHNISQFKTWRSSQQDLIGSMHVTVDVDKSTPDRYS